jgi:hypothetical protein
VTCPRAWPRPGTFRYANELVEFIRAATGDWFHIEVAAYPEYHPQARSPLDDLLAFRRKLEAGANSAITQYFYNFDAYAQFIDQCRRVGIDVPIVPGIMPISSYSSLARFSDNCGAEIPRWIRKKLESYGDDSASIRAFGLDVVTRTVREAARQRSARSPLLHAESGVADQYAVAAPWPFRNASGRLRGSGRNWLGRRLTIPRARRAASVKGLFGAWSTCSDDYFEAACKTITPYWGSPATPQTIPSKRLTARRRCSFTLTETLRPRQSTSFVTFRKPTKRFRMPTGDTTTMRTDAAIFSTSRWKLLGRSGNTILKEYCSEAIAIL